MSHHRPWRRSTVDSQRLREFLGPDLPGRPACAGAAPMFDLTLDREPEDVRDARHAAAVRVSRRCEVLDACERARQAEHRPAGVWAGRVLDPRGTEPGR